MKLHTTQIAALLIAAGIVSTADAVPKYWVGSNPNPTPGGDWDTTTANWNDTADGSGSAVTWSDLDIAVFSAGAGATGDFNVNVVGTQLPDGITFEEGHATISGGTLDFFGTIQVDSGAAGTINSVLLIAGAPATPLTKTGPGTLTLGGDNSTTFTGNIFVDEGRLKVTHSGVFGSVGTADAASDAGIINAVKVATGATLEIVDGVTVTDRVFANGDGAIRKTGAGDSTIQGGIRFQSAGTSVLADEGTLTLRQNPIFRQLGVTAVTFGGAGNIVTTSTAVGGVNLNIAVSSSRVVKVGTGTMTLNGISSWFGGLTIEGGVVSFSADTTGAGSQQLGQTSTDGTGTTAEYKPAGVILNGGTLRSTNTGNMFSNSHRGMQIGPNGGTVDTAGTLVVFQSTIRKTPEATTATLTKTGPGEFRYNANATNTRVGTDFTQLVVNQGLFRLGSVVGFDVEEGFGAVPAVPTADAIVLNGGSIGTSFGATLHANRGITLGSNGGSFNVSAASMTVPSVITGVGALNKNTAGTLTLQGANDYSGGTLVSAGTLTASGASVTLGAGDVSVTGGTLTLASTITNAIADTATLSITTAGEVNLGSGIDELIASLVLDDIPQSAGTYGSSSSGAMFQLDAFFAGAGIVTVPGVGGLPGDFNSDGSVDAADYVVWRKNENTNNPLANDGGLGTPITSDHYDLWRDNFGMTDPGSGSGLGGGAVPEPSTVALLIIGLAAFAARRRR